MKHILFEWKKMRKQKMIWFTVILALVATISLYFLHYATAGKMKAQNLTKEKSSLQQFETWLEEEKIAYSAALEKGDEAQIAELEAAIERLEQSVERREVRLQNYEGNHWDAVIQEEIENLASYLTPEAGIAIESQPIVPFTLRASKEELEWLLENDIEPFVYDWEFGSFHPTIYDDFTGRALEWWEKLSKKYGEEGLYYLYQMMPNYFVLIAILIGIFIFGNTISLESRRKKREISFYFVQPIRKWSVFFAKYFTGLFATIAFFLLVIAMPLIASLFTKGIGSLKYPILIYEGAIPNSFDAKYTNLSAENDQFYFIPMSEYGWKVIVLALAVTFFSYGLYLFISFFIKSPTVNLVIVSMLSFIGLLWLPVSKWNPFIYFDFHRVINGEIAALAINPSIEFQNGVLLLSVLGIVVMVVNAMIFRLKRV